MNNTTARTKTLAIVAVFMATTLVVGVLATATTQATTAFAYPQKKKGDENSRNGNTITIQKCKQLASESGWDNNQAQECENLICTHPGENATCTQEGARAAPKPTPVKLTCEQCFTTILNSKQKTDFETRFGTFADTCAIFVDPAEGPPSENNFRSQLQDLRIPLPTINELIACLKQAGIVFTT
jgi:hypothetical protein